jgi:hypothetical protein
LGSSLQIQRATVRLYSDTAGVNEVARQTLNQPVAVDGTEIAFADLVVRTLVVQIDEISGSFYGAAVASIAEIEDVRRGE